MSFLATTFHINTGVLAIIMDELKTNMERIRWRSRQRGGAVKMSRELMLVMHYLVGDGGAMPS